MRDPDPSVQAPRFVEEERSFEGGIYRAGLLQREGMAVLLVALALIVTLLLTAACTPVQPTPVPGPSSISQTVTVIIGGGPTASPSPGSGGQRPEVVLTRQFGETCPASVTAGPSGQDRAVRIGCSKAMTCTPKCRQTDGSLQECQVGNQVPDEFRVFAGADRISFTASGSNPAFNRDARGVAAGTALIDCTFGGVRSEPFELQVVP